MLGVSTRQVERLVQALGMEGMSKSQVSRLAGELDALVDSFRKAPLERGPYPYVWLDSVHMRSREAGRVVNVALVFPKRKTILRLVVAMLIEQNEEWMAQSRCYMSRASIDALIREHVPKPSETHHPEIPKAA